MVALPVIDIARRKAALLNSSASSASLPWPDGDPLFESASDRSTRLRKARAATLLSADNGKRPRVHPSPRLDVETCSSAAHLPNGSSADFSHAACWHRYLRFAEVKAPQCPEGSRGGRSTRFAESPSGASDGHITLTELFGSATHHGVAIH